MNNFKKIIYKLSYLSQSSGPTSSSIVEVDSQDDGDGGCTSCASVNLLIPVGSSKRVEFVKSGDPAPYSSTLMLCSGTGTEITSDFVEVITSSKAYKFGIDSVKGGSNSFTTQITVSVYDETTNALEGTYVHTRTHNNIAC